MNKFICSKCSKEFRYLSQYKKHNERKTPCVIKVPKKPTIKVKLDPPSKKQLIVHKDCILGMKELASSSVDIIICDPPYNIGKDFGNNKCQESMENYLAWCDKWIGECIRILKPHICPSDCLLASASICAFT